MVRVTVRCAAVVLLCLGLAGCGTGPSPEPSPTASGFADEAEAFAAAEETYRAYVDALNRVDLSDPETFEDVYAWTTGELNASDRKGLSAYHAEGLTVSGESTIQTIQGSSFDADGVFLDVCLDVSSVDLRGPDGESRVDPNRADIQKLVVAVVDGETSTGLAVAQISGRSEGAQC